MLVKGFLNVCQDFLVKNKISLFHKIYKIFLKRENYVWLLKSYSIGRLNKLIFEINSIIVGSIRPI